MRGIYLASFQAYHDNVNLIYQDINGKRDLDGDMMDVDLSIYDYVIATPPCNYYSRANWRRQSSVYAQLTKHLLPGILDKLIRLGKPFLVENVRNSKLFTQIGLFDKPCFIYIIGRHTYWSNILFCSDIEQKPDNIHYIGSSSRQGGFNVHQVVEVFLDTIGAKLCN